MYKANEIRPDVPQALFGLLTLLFLFKYYDDKSKKIYLILSAFSLGISFLFLQKAIFLILLIGLVLLYNITKKQITLTDAFFYFFTFILTILPYFLYLLLTHSMSIYITFNWLINLLFIRQLSPLLLTNFLLLTNSLLCILFIIGLIFYLKSFKQKLLGFISLGLLVSLVLVRQSYAQYFLVALPLVSVITAQALITLGRKNIYIFILIFLTTVLPPVSVLAIEIIESQNKEQLAKINYIISITKPTDYVYDGDCRFNLFRKDINFFWYSLYPKGGFDTYKTFYDYDYDIYKLIDVYKPKIISDYLIDDFKNPIIANHYKPSEIYEDIYLRVDTKNLQD